MMTYGLIESCDREFDEPDRVYSGCCPNGNPFERSLKRFLPTNLDAFVKSRFCSIREHFGRT